MYDVILSQLLKDTEDYKEIISQKCYFKKAFILMNRVSSNCDGTDTKGEFFIFISLSG